MYACMYRTVQYSIGSDRIGSDRIGFPLVRVCGYQEGGREEERKKDKIP